MAGVGRYSGDLPVPAVSRLRSLERFRALRYPPFATAIDRLGALHKGGKLMNRYLMASAGLAALLLSTSAQADGNGDFTTPGWYGFVNAFGAWMIDSAPYPSQQACQAAVNDMVARGGDASNYKCAYMASADDLNKIQGED